jgi:hypothetical protein
MRPACIASAVEQTIQLALKANATPAENLLPRVGLLQLLQIELAHLQHRVHHTG